jgi:hypothetical protein
MKNRADGRINFSTVVGMSRLPIIRATDRLAGPDRPQAGARAPPRELSPALLAGRRRVRLIGRLRFPIPSLSALLW